MIKKIIKRIMDISLVLIGILITSPIMVLVSFAIKFKSKGRIFYRATRVGFKCRVFQMLKFRTMVENADQIGGPNTAADDPRLTPLGLFLRRYKLDELPQFFNVLKGEMSFVGPRPDVPKYINLMAPMERTVVLSVPPGITCFDTLWNTHEEEVLAGSPDPEQTYLSKIWPKKIVLQVRYVFQRSLWLDCKIIAKTLWRIIK